MMSFTLPRFESQMLVEWEVPTVTYENSGQQVDVWGPSPPMYFSAGTKRISYIATDKAGNNGTCDVIVNVIGEIFRFLAILFVISACFSVSNFNVLFWRFFLNMVRNYSYCRLFIIIFREIFVVFFCFVNISRIVIFYAEIICAVSIYFAQKLLTNFFI